MALTYHGAEGCDISIGSEKTIREYGICTREERASDTTPVAIDVLNVSTVAGLRLLGEKVDLILRIYDQCMKYGKKDSTPNPQPDSKPKEAAADNPKKNGGWPQGAK